MEKKIGAGKLYEALVQLLAAYEPSLDRGELWGDTSAPRDSPSDDERWSMECSVKVIAFLVALQAAKKASKEAKSKERAWLNAGHDLTWMPLPQSLEAAQDAFRTREISRESLDQALKDVEAVDQLSQERRAVHGAQAAAGEAWSRANEARVAALIAFSVAFGDLKDYIARGTP